MSYQTVNCSYFKKRVLCIDLNTPTTTLHGKTLEYTTLIQSRDYGEQTSILFADSNPESLLQPRVGFRIDKPEAEVTPEEMKQLEKDFVNGAKRNSMTFIAENLISRIQRHITPGLVSILKGRAMRLDV